MTVTGTYPWMAPELIQGLPTCESCDVYSFGVVLWEMLTREIPFKGLQGFQVAWVVVENHERPLVPEHCPKKLASLMKRCWDDQPTKRPSFCMIVSELCEMMKDTELGDGANKFMESKDDWIEEINEKLEAIQDQEQKLKEKKKELEEREQKLKKWEESLKKQVKTQKLVAAVRYRNEIKKLKCQISGKGDGAISSVKDVLNHIMSNSGLKVDDNEAETNSSSQNNLFKDQSSSFFPHRHPALPMRSKSSDKLPTRPQKPDIRSNIDFTNSKTSSDVNLFSQGLCQQAPGNSVRDLNTESDWNHDFGSSKPNGTTIQKEKTSAAFNFEGSKVLKSTSAGSESDSGKPVIETWETARGDADVQKSSENLQFGADGDLQKHQIGVNTTPRRSMPSLPQITPRSASARGADDFRNLETNHNGFPSRDQIKTALQRVSKPFDRFKLDEFVDNFGHELSILSKQKRSLGRSPKAYSFDCSVPFTDLSRSKVKDETDNSDLIPTKPNSKLTSTVSETSDVSECSEKTKNSLRRQTTTEFADVKGDAAQSQSTVPDGRRLSTTRTRRSSEETCSSSSSAAQKKSTKTERRTVKETNDPSSSAQGEEYDVTTETSEKTSSNTEKSSHKKSMKSEEVVSSPLSDSRNNFFQPPETSFEGVTSCERACQTSGCLTLKSDKFVQTDEISPIFHAPCFDIAKKIKEASTKPTKNGPSIQTSNCNIRPSSSSAPCLFNGDKMPSDEDCTTWQPNFDHETNFRQNEPHKKSKLPDSKTSFLPLNEKTSSKTASLGDKALFNRSFSSPSCFISSNNSSIKERVPKKSHHNSAAEEDKKAEIPTQFNSNCPDNNLGSPISDPRRTIMMLPTDCKRVTLDGCRPPKSSVDGYQKPKSLRTRASRYQEKLKMGNQGNGLVDVHNDEVVLRKPFSSKTRRYRIATPEINGDGDIVHDDVINNAKKSASLKTRFRSGTRLVLTRQEPSTNSAVNNSRSIRRIPVQLRKPLTPDFVDGTRITTDDEDTSEWNGSSSLRRSFAHHQADTLSTTSTPPESSDDRPFRFNHNRRNSAASERSNDLSNIVCNSLNSRSYGARSATPSRPRSGYSDWQLSPTAQLHSSNQAVLRVESPLFGGPHKVYQPREVYETDDYTFIICPQGKRRR